MSQVFRVFFSFAFCAGLLFFSVREACSRSVQPELLELSYKAADRLHEQMADKNIFASPMLAATFVDSTNMKKTSDFGQALSSQVASRLSQRGYSIAEIQLHCDQLSLTPEGGLFALSRNPAYITKKISAYAVLVGIYTRIGPRTYVTVRVVRAADGVVLASSDFSLPSVRERNVGTSQRMPQPSVKTRLN